MVSEFKIGNKGDATIVRELRECKVDFDRCLRGRGVRRWVAIQNEYRKGGCVRNVDECIRRDGASVVGDASVQG